MTKPKNTTNSTQKENFLRLTYNLFSLKTLKAIRELFMIDPNRDLLIEPTLSVLNPRTMEKLSNFINLPILPTKSSSSLFILLLVTLI